MNENINTQSDFFGAHKSLPAEHEVQEQENSIEQEILKFQAKNELIAGKAINLDNFDETEIDELVTLLEKTISEAKESLSYIAKKAEEIKNNLQKISLINQTTPGQKFSKAKSLQIHSLTKKDEYRFFEIEEALSNTFILSAIPSHLIEFQLALIGEGKNANLISDELFAYLTVIRKDYIPDSYKYNLVEERLLKADMASICQACHNYLAENAAYRNSKHKFIQRLSGIDFEIIKAQIGVDELAEELKRLKQNQVTKNKESLSPPLKLTLKNIKPEQTENTFSLPSPLKEKLGLKQSQANKNQGLIVLFEKIKWQKGTEKILGEEIDYQELAEYEKTKDRSVISLILSGIKKELRPKYEPDGGRICFEEIMQATVNQQKKLSEDEISRQVSKLIADAETALTKVKMKQHDTIKAGTLTHSYLAEELIRGINLAIKTYHEKFENTSSPLKGTELKAKYKQRLKQVNIQMLAEQLKSNNCYEYESVQDYYKKIINILENKHRDEHDYKLNQFINKAKNTKIAQQYLSAYKARHSIIDGIDHAIKDYDPANIQVYDHHFLFSSVQNATLQVTSSSHNQRKAFFK